MLLKKLLKFFLNLNLLFRELWRKETALNQQLTSAKEDLAKADQALRSLAGKVS